MGPVYLMGLAQWTLQSDEFPAICSSKRSDRLTWEQTFGIHVAKTARMSHLLKLELREAGSSNILRPCGVGLGPAGEIRSN